MVIRSHSAKHDEPAELLTEIGTGGRLSLTAAAAYAFDVAE